MSTKLQIKICPTCGSEKIKKVRKNCTRTTLGQSYTVRSLEFYECPDCGEKLYDSEAMRKIEATSPVFKDIENKKLAVM